MYMHTYIRTYMNAYLHTVHIYILHACKFWLRKKQIVGPLGSACRIATTEVPSCRWHVVCQLAVAVALMEGYPAVRLQDA